MAGDRMDRLLDQVGAEMWVFLLYADLDVASYGLPPDRAAALTNFSRMGSCTSISGRSPPSPRGTLSARARSRPETPRELAYHARVNVMIQFVSHVVPPSSENACSQRDEPSLLCVQRKRHRTVLPSTVSSP